MNEIEIDGMGYSVPKPVYDAYKAEQEKVHLLRLNLAREKSRNVILSDLYADAKIKLATLTTPTPCSPTTHANKS